MYAELINGVAIEGEQRHKERQPLKVGSYKSTDHRRQRTSQVQRDAAQSALMKHNRPTPREEPDSHERVTTVDDKAATAP